MKRPLRTLVFLAFAAWFLVPDVVGAQSSTPQWDERTTIVRESALKQRIAEDLIAQREAAAGRPFDPTVREALRTKISAMSMRDLEAIQASGDIGPLVPGDTGADLVFVPIAPCRFADTRFGGLGFQTFTGFGQQRSYIVAGAIPAAQGGLTNCGVPFGVGGATAVAVNLTVAGFAGGGDVRITPFGSPIPNASAINYSPGMGFAVANGIVAQICDPAAVGCTNDFTVQVDGAGTDLVADVMGYFRQFNPNSYQNTSFTFASVPSTATSGSPATLQTLTFTPRVGGTLRVQARGYCNISDAGSATSVLLSVGTGVADIGSQSNWAVIRPTFVSGLLHQAAWDAERFIAFTRGVAATVRVLAWHESVGAGSSTDCSGTLVVNGLF